MAEDSAMRGDPRGAALVEMVQRHAQQCGADLRDDFGIDLDPLAVECYRCGGRWEVGGPRRPAPDAAEGEP